MLDVSTSLSLQMQQKLLEPENKILEVAASLSYEKLQEEINLKYNGAMLLQYFDEDSNEALQSNLTNSSPWGKLYLDS